MFVTQVGRKPLRGDRLQRLVLPLLLPGAEKPIPCIAEAG